MSSALSKVNVQGLLQSSNQTFQLCPNEKSHSKSCFTCFGHRAKMSDWRMQSSEGGKESGQARRLSRCARSGGSGEEQLSIIHQTCIEIPFSHDDCKTERMKDEVPSLVLCHQHHWVVIYIIIVYSSPCLVVDRMEELIVRLLLVESVWRQKESWSFMHLLCSGMVGFGLR